MILLESTNKELQFNQYLDQNANMKIQLLFY